MSTVLLRRAAAQMRQRVEAATPGPWASWNVEEDGRAEIFIPNGTMDTETVLEFKDFMDCEECTRPSTGDVQHIASWHPTVALEIAAFLDFAAAYGDQPSPQSPTVQFALSIACAYLGEEA